MAIEEGAGLPAWPGRLLSEIDNADVCARELVEGLRADRLNWQPRPGAWSVGQCLDHLVAANDIYLPAISDSLAGQPRCGAREITPGWFARWFIRNYIEPSPRSKRASAPSRIVPASQVDLSVLARFVSGNRVFRDLVRRASEYDVNSIRFRNPFIPVLRFSVGTGLEIAAAHQRRHLLQAARVKQSEGFPK